MDYSWLIGGKSLKELNFPDEWEYDPTMLRWKSEKHKAKVTFMGASYPTNKKKGEVTMEYIYITDKMLSNLKSLPLPPEPKENHANQD